MKTFALAGAVAALSMAFAGAASAAVTLNFIDLPAFSPSPGYTDIDTFDTTANISGHGFTVMTGNSGTGAPPANSNPFGTSYLAVQGGGLATIKFSDLTSKTVGAFEFDWGSTDTFNTLTVDYITNGVAGTENIVPGTTFPNAANGNQVSPGTNGLFMVSGSPGTTFTSISLASSQNSFEIDNLAIAVPEPATWAMMLLGLGAVGGVLRRRKSVALSLA
jgi:hypothetical protein